MGFTTSTSVRQTVLSGSIDSNGYADFLSAGTGLAVDVAASTTPIILAFAGGFDRGGTVDEIEKIASDDTISSLTASDTCYLYVERSTQTGSISLSHTTLEPVYDYVKPSSPSSGQFCFVIPEMKMYCYNGSSWDEKQVIFLGECETDASSVTDVITYALCGRYDSGWFTVYAETTYTKDDNIGWPISFKDIKGLFRQSSSYDPCIIDHNYMYIDYDSYGYGAIFGSSGNNQTKIRTAHSNGSYAYVNTYNADAVGARDGVGDKTTGDYRIIVKRSF